MEAAFLRRLLTVLAVLHLNYNVSAVPVGMTIGNITTCTAFQNGTTWGHEDSRVITITARDITGSVNPPSGTPDIFVVDMFTHNPVCTPTLATPKCVVNCAPFERPHNKNPSCMSRPRLPYPLRDAQTQWVTATAVHTGGGYYRAYVEPEIKDRYDIDVALMKQGGLNAYYFDNVWLIDTPDIVRVDSTINFNWGDGVITTYGKDYISVRWSGKLRADFTEMYYIFAKADDGVRVWVDKQLIIDQWSTCCNETWNTVNLVKDHMHDIIVEYQELKDQAMIELRWASNSVAKQIIPQNHLYYRDYTCNTPYNNFVFEHGPPVHHLDRRHQEITIGPSLYPNANFTYAYNYVTNVTGNVTEYSTGLNFTTVGASSGFRVQLHDIFNNSLEVFSKETEETMKFEFSPASSGADFTGDEDVSHYHNSMKWWPVNEEGLWQFNYTGQKSGAYHLEISTNDTGPWDPILKSPFYINSSCAASKVSSSYYFGKGSETATAGKTAFFYIQAQDQFDNNRTTYGDNLWVVFTGPQPLHAYLEYVDTGLYRAMYTAQKEGTYSMKIWMNEQVLPGTPTNVVVSEAAVYYPYCTISGPNLQAATAGLNVSLTLDYVDVFNNSIDINTAPPVSLQIIGPAPYNTTRDVTGMIVVSSSGDHVISYKPILTGTFSLHVRVAGEDVLNSPFSLKVIPGAIASWKTTAKGDLITGSRYAYVQKESAIYVQAKDSEENLLDQDVSANITMTLQCGSDVRTGTTSYTGRHGLHKVVITPTKKGAACTVKVLVRGVEIPHSPYTVKVFPSQAHHNTSVVEQITSGTAGVNIEFDITAVDEMGNNLDEDTATSTFVADVYGPNYDLATSPYLAMANITNSGNGTYHADWKPTETGTYKTYVHLLKDGVGLVGKYYTDMYLTENNFYVQRIDRNFNFDWELRNPFGNDLIYPTEYWSAMWYGRFKVPVSETFRITASIDANCGVRLWLDDSKSGIVMARSFQEYAATKKALIDEYDPYQGGTDVFADILLNKDTYYHILIHYRDYVGKASLKLYWESPSTPKSIIPASAFSTFRNVTAPYDVTITNAASFHNTSTTHRTGDLNLTYAKIESKGIPTKPVKAGIDFDFTIQLRDQFGNLQMNGGETADLEVKLVEIHNFFTVQSKPITDNNNGTYHVVIEPTLVGDHLLYVTYKGKNLKGSPWEIHVDPGNAYAPTSWAQGTGYNNATVNFEARFYIYVRDMESNMRQSKDTVTVVTSGPVTLPVAVEYVGGGVYNATYTPVTKGTYTFQVYINKKKLNTTSTVQIAPDIASAVDSSFTTTNGTGPSTSVTIQTTDNQGNNLNGGGHHFFCEAVKTYDGTKRRGIVTDNTDGTYSVAFALPNTEGGIHMVNLYLAKGKDGIGDGLTAKYYTNPWLSGQPVLTRVDPYINFNWGIDLITPTAKDYVSIEWTGYIMPKYAETYDFSILSDEGLRLTIDHTLIIDKWLDSANTFTGNYTFPTANLLYPFKLEWRDTVFTARCHMSWSSTSQGMELVPQNALFSHATHITGSPIRVKRS